MSYQTVHDKIIAKVQAHLPEYVQRTTWDRTQIEAHQLTQLRQLLQHVCKHSPWYQQRCQHLDIDNLQLSDVEKIPPTTKQDIMDHWDQIICVPGITKAIAEDHLQQYREGKFNNPFYQDKYYFTATGGSTGKRGLFIWDIDFFVKVGCATFRYQYRDELQKPIAGKKKIAVLTAPTLIHASTPLFSITPEPAMQAYCISADTPLLKICEQLNHIQPTHLIGFSLVIQELAKQALEGRLIIKPQRVSTNSEPLDQDARQVIKQAWDLKVNNMWGSVEVGVMGVESDEHEGMLLSEDFAIIEAVDDELQSINKPEAAKKLLITNLYNYTLPIIRYEVDDVVHITTSTKSAYRIAKDIKGRTDDWFMYGNDLQIHPMVFRHILGQEPEIIEYQVKQTTTGASIKIIANGEVNCDQITQALIKKLQQAGLTTPDIKVMIVDSIARHQETGKFKRFVPLKMTK